jgi:hypothetical protein
VKIEASFTVFKAFFEIKTINTSGSRRLLALQKDSIYVFPEMKLRGLDPNFHIRISVSDLYNSHDRSTYFAAAKLAD